MKTRITHEMAKGGLGDYAVHYKTWIFGKWKILTICKSISEAEDLARSISEFRYVIKEYKNGKKIK